MSEVHVSWQNNEQTIFLFEFPIEWKWAEFRASQTVSTEMLNSRNADIRQLPVGIVFTIPTKGKLPMGHLSATLQALSTRDERIIKLVLVSGNAFIRMMWQTVSGLLPNHMKSYGVAETVDEAEHMVKARLAEFSQNKV